MGVCCGCVCWYSPFHPTFIYIYNKYIYIYILLPFLVAHMCMILGHPTFPYCWIDKKKKSFLIVPPPTQTLYRFINNTKYNMEKNDWHSRTVKHYTYKIFDEFDHLTSKKRKRLHYIIASRFNRYIRMLSISLSFKIYLETGIFRLNFISHSI